MKTKSRMRMEVKEISEAGSFEGLLSPYGSIDRTGDVVDPGAYTKTLKDHGNKVPMLWQHKTDVPIGELTLEDRPDGLWCSGQLLMQLADAQKAYLLIKARIVKGLSIGFESVRDAVSDGVRHLKEIRLYEGSIVTFPAAESALIFSVKAAGDAMGTSDFNDELMEIQLQDAGCQMRMALASALQECTWCDLTRDGKISAAETIIQQFSDAYMAFLPQYLDMLSEMYGEMEMWAKKRFEVKAGAMISAANKATIKAACEQIKSGHEALSALVADDAGMSTSSAEAVETKSEPVIDHSALSSKIDALKGQLVWN